MMSELEWEAFLPTTSSSLPNLSVLDDRCRCSVCKDYLHGPMMTSCGHTFCSLCIRRALNADGRCPSCRSLEEESKLRKNMMIEEIVESFLPFRTSLMKCLPRPDNQPMRSAPREYNTAAEIADSDLEDVGAEHTSPAISTATRSGRITRSSRSRAQVQNHSSAEKPAIPPGFVNCPVCQRAVHQDKADAHVNKCLEGRASPLPSSPPDCHSDSTAATTTTQSPYFSSSKPDRGTTTQRNEPNPQAPQKQTAQHPTMKRMAKISYAAMTDAKLRKFVADLGLSTTGNRTQLQRRCTEYIAMWNSNLDSKHPKSKKELLSDMRAWDRVQAKPVPKITNDEIDSAHENGQFDDTFASLISQARESMKKRKAEEKSESVDAKVTSVEEVKKDDDVHDHKRQHIMES